MGLRAMMDRPNKAAQKRRALRDQLWPDADDKVWSRHTGRGFTSVPRLLPHVVHLIDELAGSRGSPGYVYLELWFRAFDEGIVSIDDELKHAYAAGYTGTRALRTWRGHMLVLQELGFIRVKAAGNREIGHVLLVNPILVCQELKDRGRAPEEWWTAFVQRANEIGAELPPATPAG
jgi:hypothetical protein